MEEIKLSPEELKRVIANGKVLGSGYFGTVFTYQDRLIKLDKNLYSIIKNSSEKDVKEEIEWYYNHPYHGDFNDRKQIEELVDKQKRITLTKLPQGIVTLKNVNQRTIGISPGILIPYHLDHQNLNTLNAKDYHTLLIILKKLLLIVKQLADNQIAQEDFGKMDERTHQRDYNILYKDTTPQVIDLSGMLVRVGREFRDASLMYRGLGEVVLDYFQMNHFESPYKENEIENEKQIKEMLHEYQRQARRSK